MSKNKQDEQMEAQSKEFKAACKFSEALNALPAIVDDDYPEMRHYYESALASLLDAMKKNGRFEKGNRYHLTEV